MLSITLYGTTDDARVIDKTLTTVKSISAKPVEPMTILTPRFTIDYDADVIAANYAYISDFGRYYYITDISITTGNRMTITLKVDVLKTYADDIKECSVVVSRSEAAGNPTYIPDSSLPINPNKKELLTAKSDFTTNDGNIYLVRVKESTVKYSRE